MQEFARCLLLVFVTILVSTNCWCALCVFGRGVITKGTATSFHFLPARRSRREIMIGGVPLYLLTENGWCFLEVRLCTKLVATAHKYETVSFAEELFLQELQSINFYLEKEIAQSDILFPCTLESKGKWKRVAVSTPASFHDFFYYSSERFRLRICI